jgi:aminoglycoside phosphotransferase (APT) family kinase protein
MATDDLDPVAILASLGIGEPAAVAPVSGGRDTAIWRVEHGGAVYALRVFRADQVRACEREAAALEAALAGGLPVPRIHAQGVWHDRPAVLLTWCPGRTLVQELSEQPWRIWPLGVAFGRMQARIHAVPAPVVPHQAPDAWLAWAGPDETALRERLQAMARQPAALLHMDYHPLNVLTDGRHMTCVLDWVNVHTGDPRADVARTFTILRLEPLGSGPRALVTLIALRWLERAWRHGYQQVAGPLGDLAPFYAWAGAVMGRDRAPREGRAGMPPDQLERIRRWTVAQKRRAGLPV